MSNIAIKGNASGTGSMTLESPNTNSNRTVTVPDVDGQMMVSGNMPAFSAYNSANQTITSSTWTKVACNTEEFDTANAFDSTTNYRFTPQVAGYYQVNAMVTANGGGTTAACSAIYKNGSATKYGAFVTSTSPGCPASAIVFLNGSTDYIEMYAYIVAATPSVGGGGALSYFQTALARTS